MHSDGYYQKNIIRIFFDRCFIKRFILTNVIEKISVKFILIDTLLKNYFNKRYQSNIIRIYFDKYYQQNIFKIYSNGCFIKKLF